MKFCFLVCVKFDGEYSNFCEIVEELELFEECEHLVSLGYDIIEVFRICWFDVRNRPMMMRNVGVSMTYEEFLKEIYEDE